MLVRLKLFATYRRHLPPGSEGYACDLSVSAGTRVGEVMAQFRVPTDGTAVILVNGQTAAPDQVLREGDAVAAFPAMAGG
ncbi:MAG: MoaD/ThiS family protein [Anaerolineae bacterium]|nr:MoaD/ThiS family protein [Anaerolineae bacterium]